MNCSICNNILKETSIIQVYFTFTTHTNTLLVNFIQKILNCDFILSKYICLDCYKILEDLDFTEQSRISLKKQLHDRFFFINEQDTFLKDASTQTVDIFSEKVNIDVIGTIKKESDKCIETRELEIVKNSNDVLSAEDKKGNSKDKTNLSSEINKIHDKKTKPFECTVCRKCFVSKNGMLIHQRKHKNISTTEYQPTNKDSIKLESLECDVNIEDDSSKSENLTESESNVESQKNHYSNNCITKKKTKKKHNGNTIKPLKYPCPQCPKMWRTMGELRSHISSHSTLRPYICEVCGQAYKHKSALDVHVGMHNGINPFSCEYCHKAFTQKGALQRHLPIHTGEAPYQCDLCGKRFVHHTSFNMHTLAHTGQKSYKCNTCGLALLSGSHLKRHMRVHTGERKYACTQCGKRFAERYNLAAHQRLHEAGPSTESKRLYRCQVCGVVFERKSKLEEHLSNNHNTISETIQPRKWLGVGHFLSNTAYPEVNFNAEATTVL